MTFGAFYGSATAAGIAISEMRNMTWWQFSEAIDGFVSSKTGDKDAGLSMDEEAELEAMLSAPI